MEDVGHDPRAVALATESSEYVEFFPAATSAAGRFACSACGFQLTILHVLPRCPICREGLWERADWSPFSHRI